MRTPATILTNFNCVTLEVLLVISQVYPKASFFFTEQLRSFASKPNIGIAFIYFFAVHTVEFAKIPTGVQYSGEQSSK